MGPKRTRALHARNRKMAKTSIYTPGKARLPRRRSAVIIPIVMALACKTLAAQGSVAPPHPVDFNRDIRPILSDTCFTCHGPDAGQRQADLRLDTQDGLFADRGDYRIVVPGDTSKSKLFERISAANEALRMPLPQSGKKLTQNQIELIREWIAQGAKWAKHWAFIPPVRPPLPAVKKQRWARNQIDQFVLARLDNEGLEPAHEAEKSTLIRRVALDVTGLPPTPAEVSAFLADAVPDAYEKVVDRLLASPRYGERMAAEWLDAARYADTNGYQTDAERFMWRWRDWVIEAFNRNMPFDQFTIEQLAGDLLPNPTLDQRIATGFNRNHRGNGEGGIIPEEYAVVYVADRVETTATVWMGLTIGCARCHDHKYDPIRQKEFYQAFAFFNNIPEKGMANKYGNSPPLIKAPTVQQLLELKALDRKLAAAEKALAMAQPEWEGAQSLWEKSLEASKSADWAPAEDSLASFALDQDVSSSVPLAKDGKQIEPEFREGALRFAPGRIGQAASFDGAAYIEAGDAANFGFYDRFTLAAWVFPTAPNGTIVSRTKDTPDGGQGYGLYLHEGKLQANLVVRVLDDSLRVETRVPLELNRWHHVAMTYDGTREATGVRIYVDGENQTILILLDQLNQPFATDGTLKIGAGGIPGNRFQGLLDDVRIYKAVLTPPLVAALATPEKVNEIAAIPPRSRTPGQAEKIRRHFLESQAPPRIRNLWARLVEQRKERDKFAEGITTVMVMQELETPRDAFMLVRGAYDQHGEKVGRGVPAVFPPLPGNAPSNRLGLARWLVTPSHPLTARVTVNRFWQMYFGTGLVKTAENFGSQGEPPSHPELLDWLATEFIRTGWNVKALQKLILTSATYRQSSRVSPQLFEKDPENRLLARGPRVRLPAGTIRDQALAVSGLLREKIGGPSVKPYQPDGLWKELSGGEDYKADKGENLYRRSLYTFWKRTAPPPAMAVFDAAGRETCSVRAMRTSSPLQALNLMNDVAYLEASRALAERMIQRGGPAPGGRLAFAFRRATARAPSAKEREILLGNLAHFRARYQNDPGAAEKFVGLGEHPRNQRLDVRELAAYTAVASLILNLDETITKQ